MKKRILALVLAMLMTAALCACGGGKAQNAEPASSPGSTGETQTAAPAPEAPAAE